MLQKSLDIIIMEQDVAFILGICGDISYFARSYTTWSTLEKNWTCFFFYTLYILNFGDVVTARSYGCSATTYQVMLSFRHLTVEYYIAPMFITQVFYHTLHQRPLFQFARIIFKSSQSCKMMDFYFDIKIFYGLQEFEGGTSKFKKYRELEGVLQVVLLQYLFKILHIIG